MDLRKTIVEEVPPIQGDQETTLWNPRVGSISRREWPSVLRD